MEFIFVNGARANVNVCCQILNSETVSMSLVKENFFGKVVGLDDGKGLFFERANLDVHCSQGF